MKYYKLVNSMNSIILDKCENDSKIVVPCGYVAKLITKKEFDSISKEQSTSSIEIELVD